jgi:hypothetical protein
MVYPRIVWQYWEQASEYPNGTAYIDLCHETAEIHQTSGKGYKLIRLNKDNVLNYIDLHPMIKNLGSSSNQLAQKSDYIRSKLLCKYGGAWLDSDTVVLESLDNMFDMLDRYNFYGFKDYNILVINAFACHKESPSMIKWVENNNKILDDTKGTNICFGELGHKSLQKCLINNPDVFIDDKSPSIFDCGMSWKYYYSDESIIPQINKRLFVQIYNGMMTHDNIRNKSRQDWLTGNSALSQLFRLAGINN